MKHEMIIFVGNGLSPLVDYLEGNFSLYQFNPSEVLILVFSLFLCDTLLIMFSLLDLAKADFTKS